MDGTLSKIGIIDLAERASQLPRRNIPLRSMLKSPRRKPMVASIFCRRRLR
jgi:hypothetical protein